MGSSGSRHEKAAKAAKAAEPTTLYAPQVALLLPNDQVILAICRNVPPNRKVVTLLRNSRTVMRAWLALAKREQQATRFPAFPPTLFANRCEDVAMELDADHWTVVNLLCDLCADAESVEVQDNFLNAPCTHSLKTRAELVADIKRRVATMVVLNYSINTVEWELST